MKLPILIIVLTLIGCDTVRFKVGDCIINNSPEEWELLYYQQIVNVGKHKYRTKVVSINISDVYFYSTIDFGLEEFHTIIKCPIE